MKVAIIGSRNLTVNNLEKYLPEGVTEIVSGGAKGIDTCAERYAVGKSFQRALRLRWYLSLIGSAQATSFTGGLD